MEDTTAEVTGRAQDTTAQPDAHAIPDTTPIPQKSRKILDTPGANGSGGDRVRLLTCDYPDVAGRESGDYL